MDYKKLHDDLFKEYESLQDVSFNRGALLDDIFARYPDIKYEMDMADHPPPAPSLWRRVLRFV